MLELLGLFFSTWAFGSVGGTAYAVANGFSKLQTIVAIALINTMVVVIWFGIIGFVTKKIEGFLERYRKKGVEIPLLTHRKKSENLATAGVGALAALTIGSLWAVVGAYAINADKWLAWTAITPCAVIAGLVWTLGSLGIIPFLPSPWLLYFVAVVITSISVGRKVYQNREQIKETIKQIYRRRGGKLR